MHTSGNLTQRVHLQIYDRCQMAMGIVIIVAYMSSLIASQILPEEDSYEQQVIQSVEYAVTVIFTTGVCQGNCWHAANTLFPAVTVMLQRLSLNDAMENT